MKWPRAMFLQYFWNILCRGMIEWKKKKFAFSYSKSMQTFKHEILISEEYNVLVVVVLTATPASSLI